MRSPWQNWARAGEAKGGLRRGEMEKGPDYVSKLFNWEAPASGQGRAARLNELCRHDRENNIC
jgi:hypothetical protein